MVNWKIPAVVAGVGALISLIAGIAGGNPFGIIVLRMLLSALLAGGLGFGVGYVLRRFLPEIAGLREKEREVPSVDILIDEDVGPAAPEARPTEIGPEAEALELDEGAEPLPAMEVEPVEAELAASVEEAEEAPEAAGEAAALDGEALPDLESPVQSTGGLDSLPDMGGLSPDGEYKGAPAFRSDLVRTQVDSVLKGQDPASLAKAVRSFLKKDQEG